MSEFLIIYFSFYLSLIGLIVFVGFFLQQRKEQSYYSAMDGIDLSEVTVLIPFRNEEKRISVLLESIKGLKVAPHKFIFINDHSDDNGVEFIQNSLTKGNYEILNLPDEIKGKKMALRYAMKSINSLYVLTLDADVVFNADFFEELSSLQQAEMYLRPAIMKADRFFEHLYEIDLSLVNAVNIGVAGWKRPIMASGANLLYAKSVFDEVDSIDEHAEVASGDDMYLLKDFRENNKEVRLLSGINQAIYTETPQSFKEFIDQRLRWLGKTGDLKDHLSTGMALIQSVLTLVFFTLIIYYSLTKSWTELGILFGMKTLIDLIVFYPYLKRINRIVTWAFIPLYELLFPLYTLIILLLIYTYKPKWKGRKIKHS